MQQVKKTCFITRFWVILRFLKWMGGMSIFAIWGPFWPTLGSLWVHWALPTSLLRLVSRSTTLTLFSNFWQARCNDLVEIWDTSDKSREITTTEPPHLYLFLFFALQLLKTLFNFCGVGTICFLYLSSSFCLKKIENSSEKSGVLGWRKIIRIFLSRSVVAVFHLTNLVDDRHFILLVHFGIFFCSNSITRIIIRCLQADIHSWL